MRPPSAYIMLHVIITRGKTLVTAQVDHRPHQSDRWPHRMITDRTTLISDRTGRSQTAPLRSVTAQGDHWPHNLDRWPHRVITDRTTSIGDRTGCSRLTRDKTSRKERLNVGTSVTGTWKRWGKGATTTKTKADYWRAVWHGRQREVPAQCIKDRAIKLVRTRTGPERSAWLDQITLVSNRYRRASKTPYHNSSICAPEKGWQCSLHHPDSMHTIAERILIQHWDLYVLSKYRSPSNWLKIEKISMGYPWDWFKSPFPWVSHGTDLSHQNPWDTHGNVLSHYSWLKLPWYTIPSYFSWDHFKSSH